MNKNVFKKILAFFLIIVHIIFAAFLLKKVANRTISRTFFAADTVCSITIKGESKVLDEAVDLCNTLSDKLNFKEKSSKVSVLNSKGYLQNADEDILKIVKKGLYFSSLSNGAFDITVKPLTDIWDFKSQTIPSEKSVNNALEKIDYKSVKISQNQINLNGAQLDLGGIAKGYIAEQIKIFLTKENIKEAIINLGGNVTVIGDNGKNNYNIGVKKPFTEEIILTLNCSNTSVVTSGTYQRYFKKDNSLYHHILSTKTGYPINNGLSSVTIIAKDSTDADALSTVCFTLGKEKGLELVNSLKDTEAIFIDNEYNITLSNNLSIDKNNVITIKNQLEN